MPTRTTHTHARGAIGSLLIVLGLLSALLGIAQPADADTARTGTATTTGTTYVDGANCAAAAHNGSWDESSSGDWGSIVDQPSAPDGAHSVVEVDAGWSVEICVKAGNGFNTTTITCPHPDDCSGVRVDSPKADSISHSAFRNPTFEPVPPSVAYEAYCDEEDGVSVDYEIEDATTPGIDTGDGPSAASSTGTLVDVGGATLTAYDGESVIEDGAPSNPYDVPTALDLECVEDEPREPSIEWTSECTGTGGLVSGTITDLDPSLAYTLTPSVDGVEGDPVSIGPDETPIIDFPSLDDGEHTLAVVVEVASATVRSAAVVEQPVAVETVEVASFETVIVVDCPVETEPVPPSEAATAVAQCDVDAEAPAVSWTVTLVDGDEEAAGPVTLTVYDADGVEIGTATATESGSGTIVLPGADEQVVTVVASSGEEVALTLPDCATEVLGEVIEREPDPAPAPEPVAAPAPAVEGVQLAATGLSTGQFLLLGWLLFALGALVLTVSGDQRVRA